jgi:hypothetical protein
MKTSNKLLIGLVLLLFSLPLILMMGFKAAVKNNHYVVRSNTGYEVSEPKEVKAFTAIKLNGVPYNDEFGLKTNIKYGDKFSYFIKNYDMDNPEKGRTDNLRVSLAGDTLVVDYSFKAVVKVNEPSFFYGVEIDITLPRAVPVIASGTTIAIDSSAVALGAMNFQLANQASLYADGVKIIQQQETGDPSSGKVVPYQTVFPAFTIDANNAFIRIGDHVNIKNLKVNLNGKSTINFSEAVAIDTLSGHISEASVFNAPYRFSKFLK